MPPGVEGPESAGSQFFSFSIKGEGALPEGPHTGEGPVFQGVQGAG